MGTVPERPKECDLLYHATTALDFKPGILVQR
jgi:hypothetical protein